MNAAISTLLTEVRRLSVVTHNVLSFERIPMHFFEDTNNAIAMYAAAVFPLFIPWRFLLHSSSLSLFQVFRIFQQLLAGGPSK
ncbi:hypothetical protein P3L10_000736 [Capsicum annuum]